MECECNYHRLERRLDALVAPDITTACLMVVDGNDVLAKRLLDCNDAQLSGWAVETARDCNFVPA